MSSIALAFLQVLDIDDVANGTLMYVAQAFLLAGSIFGLDYYLQKFRQMMNQPPTSAGTTTMVAIAVIMMTQLPLSAQVIIHHEPEFRSVYDLDTKCPRQVEWTIQSSDLGTIKRMPGWKFVSVRHHDLEVSKHDDFRNEPYDRGHLCPAADRSSDQRSMLATFQMINVAAQTPSLNRGQWLATEKYCRDAAVMYDSVCVLAIPVFLNRDTVRIGQNQIAVPHAFFKACWLPGRDSVLNCWFLFNHEKRKNHPKRDKK